MRITNCGSGIHPREVPGVSILASLPNDWFAYTNLDLATAPGTSREIDIIMVVEDRILIVDLKDWAGPIESRDGRWFNRGRDHGPSPVAKISENSRQVYLQLKAHLGRHGKGKIMVPKVQGLVVLTKATDLEGLAETEVRSVMGIATFTAMLRSKRQRIDTLGAVPPYGSLTTNEWKDQLSKFFNVSKGVFTPGRRSFGEFYAESDQPVFEHPGGLYSEFNASDERQSQQLGILRLWDFTKADVRFQTAEGRSEIAGREQEVMAYLEDRSENCDTVLVGGKTRDPNFSPSYWEVFERKRRLHRLMDFAGTELVDLDRDGRLLFARQLLASLDVLHLAETAHLDLGPHSIWLQRPSTVRLSHLMSASYPDIRTLGKDRYQFLVTGLLPEDEFGERGAPKQRDVFLVASAIHRILFDRAPRSSDGCAEWNPEFEGSSEFLELHDWFAKALAWEPAARFCDAGEALLAFNAATAIRPTPAEVLEGLERHQNTIASQLGLFAKYPPAEVLHEDEKKVRWRSCGDGRDVLVKLWKSASWGDQKREGPRILDFLDRLSEMAAGTPRGCAKVLEVFWLGDAVAMVQEWVDRPDLARLIAEESLPDKEGRYALILSLSRLVQDLHEQHITHGDLKPSNVMVDPSRPEEPLIVDMLEFSPTTDGEPVSSRYAPPVGGNYERDCFALTVLAEDLLQGIDDSRWAAVRTAIKTIRREEPANATLLPLIDALTRHAPVAKKSDTLELRFPNIQEGELLADEGSYYLRQLKDRRALVIRGACEEIVVYVSPDGKPVRIVRRGLDQSRIRPLRRHEFGEFHGRILIQDASVRDLSALEPLLSQEDVVRAIALGEPPTDVSDGDGDEDREGDLIEEVSPSDPVEDDLIEAIVAEAPPRGDVDVAQLWSALVDVEKELITYGHAVEDSVFDRNLSRHRVQFDLLTGSLDYNRRDRVLVERAGRNDEWRAVAQLDLVNSRPHALVLESNWLGQSNGAVLIKAGDELRFRSRLEETSFDRRQSAVDRIVTRASRVRNLIDVVNPASGLTPMVQGDRIPPRELCDKYGLNDLQGETLSKVLATRPLSLVQGPPGTGKTVFIAALVHAALTRGIARNVLLSSQAHEAVNNAAEAVLRLFADAGEVPSILRVGAEGSVSERLLPFHVERVEQLYKDRFRAEAREKLAIAAKGLGIEAGLGARLAFIELAVRPVLIRIEELSAQDDQDRRIEALRDTISQQLSSVGLDLRPDGEPDTIMASIISSLLADEPSSDRPSPDRIARFQSVASLARDFIGTVSTEQRSLETFLAGTRQIVAGTCVGLGRSSLGLTSTAFDLVIVDEAARCTASELAVPIQAGSNVVLVGDQKQLEPLHPEGVVESVATQLGCGIAEVARSDFERVFESPFGRLAGHTLKMQYRMLRPIGEVVSASFYGRALSHGREDLVVDPQRLPPELEKSLAWLDTHPLGARAGQGERDRRKSIPNVVEADSIVALLKRWGAHEPFLAWLEEQTTHEHSIGIICAYAAQRDLVRRKLMMAAIHPSLRQAIKIDTIDSYQGKENPIVIVSLVRNNRNGHLRNGEPTIKPGFLAKSNRINVAISRAMDRLVIVGSRSRWEKDGPMDRISAAFEEACNAGEATVIDVEELLDVSVGPAINSPANERRYVDER